MQYLWAFIAIVFECFAARKQKTDVLVLYVYSLQLELLAPQAVCPVMFRFVLFLTLLLVAVTTLPGAWYNGHSVPLPMAAGQQVLMADIGGSIKHAADIEADAGVQQDCGTSKPCSSCKLCHVCTHAALSADAASASLILTALHTQPTHAAATWLSAEHAPDFKPPIL